MNYVHETNVNKEVDNKNLNVKNYDNKVREKSVNYFKNDDVPQVFCDFRASGISISSVKFIDLHFIQDRREF